VNDGKTRYGYADAISGFFEFPTENARRILPPHLEPVEPHHGTSIFAMTVFDFDESMVGAYGEVVMAVIVSPLVKPGERLPKSAFFPYQVATTTQAAREHAIERWHLPHWMEDVAVSFEREDRTVTAHVKAGGEPVAALTINDHSWQPVSHLYQSFMKNDAGAYLAQIIMEGEQSEHEEELGKLVLHEHPFNQHLEVGEVYDVPFRELWMRSGRQTFDPLITLPPV
jgi:Acetoacetate decarboxylase (ADC)